MQQTVGDRCMQMNAYFLQNLSENSTDRIVPHTRKTAPGLATSLSERSHVYISLVGSCTFNLESSRCFHLNLSCEFEM